MRCGDRWILHGTASADRFAFNNIASPSRATMKTLLCLLLASAADGFLVKPPAKHYSVRRVAPLGLSKKESQTLGLLTFDLDDTLVSHSL